MMKTLSNDIHQYLLIFLVLLTACGDSSGPPIANDANEPETADNYSGTTDPITSIQQQYQKITAALNAAQLSVDSMEYDCETDPQGGRLNLYRKNGQLMMVSHDYYMGDHFSRSETFYLRNERPVFALVEDFSWRFSGPENSDPSTPNTIDEVTEHRYYFTDYKAGKTQKAIRCLQKDYVIRSWIDIPTNPDEVPNKTVDCGEKATSVLARFQELTNEKFNGNCAG